MNISISKIQQIVSEITNISIDEINSASRKAHIVQARHLSMHFSRWNTNLPMLKIARSHGKENHATVIHADESISFDIKRNSKLKETHEKIKLSINSLSLG